MVKLIVNFLNTGMLFTPMVYSNPMTEEIREARRNRSLLRTEGNGWDTGAAVRFLASDEARWITGVTLPVDAGATAATTGQGKHLSQTLPSGEEGKA
jgi:NAD(P)-dependent dehydrogenase (short-subunit alcohol dehydrogenase family)